MPQKRVGPTRRKALSFLAAAPFAVAASPAAAQYVYRWDPKLAKPFDFSRFDRLQLSLVTSFPHRTGPDPDYLETTSNKAVIRPGDKVWPRLQRAIAGLPVHDRGSPLGPDTFFQWLVRTFDKDNLTHDLKFVILGNGGVEGELDGRPIFLGRELPDLLRQLSLASEIPIEWPLVWPPVYSPTAPQMRMPL